MPEFPVQVDQETADAIAVETDLLGFEEADAYLAWIVRNRAAIEQGTEADDLLAAYRDRIARLEEQLEAAGVEPVAPDEDCPDADETDDSATGAPAADAEESAAEAEEPAAAGSADDTDATSGRDGSPDAGEAVESAESTETPAVAACSDPAGAVAGPHGPDASSDGPEAASTTARDAPSWGGPTTERLEGDGDFTLPSSTDPADGPAAGATTEPGGELTADGGSTASSRATDDGGATAPDTPGEADSDSGTGGPSPSDDTDEDAQRAASDGGTPTEGITSMHLRPERVQRVSEDPIAEDAGELSNVETARLDELSRRAVARTRQRLDRDVETGLDYESSAAMDASDVRPGEDLADLDALDVPGRSSDDVERRRAVVGRALALLRDEGRARKSDVVDALYEEHPAGYETADSWWRCVRSALEQVDAVDGGHVWEYEA